MTDQITRDELLAKLTQRFLDEPQGLEQRFVKRTGGATSAQVSAAIQTLVRRGVLVKVGFGLGHNTRYQHKTHADAAHEAWLATVPSAEAIKADARLRLEYLIATIDDASPTERAHVARLLRRDFPLHSEED